MVITLTTTYCESAGDRLQHSIQLQSSVGEVDIKLCWADIIRCGISKQGLKVSSQLIINIPNLDDIIQRLSASVTPPCMAGPSTPACSVRASLRLPISPCQRVLQCFNCQQKPQCQPSIAHAYAIMNFRQSSGHCRPRSERNGTRCQQAGTEPPQCNVMTDHAFTSQA